MNLTLFVQETINGIALGSIYALIALGYTMVYGIIELINFAHGDVFCLGSFISLAILGVMLGHKVPTGAAVVVLVLIVVFALTMLLTGLVGMAIERVAYRRLRNSPRLAPLITAVGMSFFLEGIMYIWRGPSPLDYPALLPNVSVHFAGLSLTLREAFVFIVAVGLMLGLSAFVTRTRLGKAMRATAQDREAALLMGISIDRTIAVTFFIGSALAGAAGVIQGLYYNFTFFSLGFRTGIIAFTAAVLGGIGNVTGAALGGFLIGLVSAYGSAYFGETWSDAIVFAVLIGVLVFRPRGLLGMRVPERT